MKQRLSAPLCAGLCIVMLLQLHALAESIPLPVFPGAQGYGIHTPAGRGGALLRVTSLAAEGPGTLRAALEAKGPRVVVFEVGGVIDLNGTNLVVSEPFLTVAGQTAPAPGITLVKGSLLISSHDVLIQHLRVRPGDAGKPKRSGWEPDGMTLYNPPGTTGAHHIVIDHCSFTWAVDENLSASGQRHEGPGGTAHQVTFSRNIIAEALNDSSHAKGPHSKGTLIHDHARDIAIIGNLYASNVERNPVLKPDAGAVVVNNLIYNPGKKAIHSYWTPNEYKGQKEGPKPCSLVAVGNVLWYGPDTPQDMPLVAIAANKGEVYVKDNLALDRGNKPVAEVGGTPVRLTEPQFWPVGLQAQPAGRVADSVMAQSGALPAWRDAVDSRIVEGVRSRTGRIINSQDEVGGYPQIKPVTRKLLAPDRPQADDDRDGYTNLEEWLHRLSAEAEAPARRF